MRQAIAPLFIEYFFNKGRLFFLTHGNKSDILIKWCIPWHMREGCQIEGLFVLNMQEICNSHNKSRTNSLSSMIRMHIHLGQKRTPVNHPQKSIADRPAKGVKSHPESAVSYCIQKYRHRDGIGTNVIG